MSAGSADPVRPPSHRFAPRRPRSGQEARRDVLRLVKGLTLAAALLAALAAGFVLGGAARKKIYRATRGYA